MATGHAGSKFGLLPESAREAIDRIRRSSVLRCDGVHTHVGSQLLNTEQLAAAVEPIAALGTFDVYDLGGGLGVRYTYDEHPPSLDDYADAMVGQARALLPGDARIIIEPGRSMVATSACTVYRITTIKRGEAPMSRSTAEWATTSRSRCTTSGSRPRSSTASAGASGSRWWGDTANPVTS